METPVVAIVTLTIFLPAVLEKRLILCSYNSGINHCYPHLHCGAWLLAHGGHAWRILEQHLHC
jgi:hypothetical protein